MHRTHLAAAAALALAATLMLLAPAPARAAEPLPWPDPWSGYMSPPPWAYRNLPFLPYAGPIGGPCAGLGVHWMVRATGYAAGFMDLSASQMKALATLEDAAKVQAGRLRDICRDASDWQGSAAERMQRLEQALDAARDAVHELRPMYEAFYNGLSARQKQVVDDITAGRGPGVGPGRWGWWGDY